MEGLVEKKGKLLCCRTLSGHMGSLPYRGVSFLTQLLLWQGRESTRAWALNTYRMSSSYDIKSILQKQKIGSMR